MFNPVVGIRIEEPVFGNKVNNTNLDKEITEVAMAMEEHKGRMLTGTGGLQHVESVSKKRYFGVHMNSQLDLDFTEVRRSILQELNLPADTKIVQVIGDSGRFSPLGTAVGAKFLQDHLNERDLLLWGYTGKPIDERGCCEVNQLVTSWLQKNPARFSHALANVVDEHTPLAISKWKCSIARENQNFYLVHGGAKYGDDTISSDKLTNKAFCLEGGMHRKKTYQTHGSQRWSL